MITDGSSIAAMIFSVAPQFGQCSKSMPNATRANDRTGSKARVAERQQSGNLDPASIGLGTANCGNCESGALHVCSDNDANLEDVNTLNESNSKGSKLLALALWLANVLFVAFAAISIYWFQFGVYMLGNAWKDNSTSLMVAINVANLGVGLTAIFSALFSKLKLAYIALVIEVVLVSVTITLF